MGGCIKSTSCSRSYLLEDFVELLVRRIGGESQPGELVVSVGAEQVGQRLGSVPVTRWWWWLSEGLSRASKLSGRQSKPPQGPLHGYC